MGVAVADLDNDGDDDLFMTHLTGETNTVFLNEGQGVFDDASIEVGLAAPSLGGTGFGTTLFDYDLDGRLDVFVANGSVQTDVTLANQGHSFPFGQPNQLFHQEEPQRFVESSNHAGNSFHALDVSRGAAFGDIDNDGDPDVLLANNNGPARLLVNNVGHQSTWVGFRAVNPSTGGDVLGARIGVMLENGHEVWRSVATAGSYASANDPRVVIGLGDTVSSSVEARVEWPDGRVERFGMLELRRYHELRRGEGEPVS